MSATLRGTRHKGKLREGREDGKETLCELSLWELLCLPCRPWKP